ncbi:MAG: response regulator [Chlamydiae bacterium]|nr:response regulator [Chlamydiota bacterium]
MASLSIPDVVAGFSKYGQDALPYVKVDASRRIIDANEKANNMFGCLLKGLSFDSLLHPIDRHRNLESIVPFFDEEDSEEESEISSIEIGTWTFISQTNMQWSGIVTVIDSGEVEEENILRLPTFSGDEIVVRGIPLVKEEMQILLVDDQPMIHLILTSLLETIGFNAETQVTTAENGVEALERVKEKEFHIIVMDNEMPKMNGVVAGPLVRKIEQAKNRNPSTLIFSSGSNVTPPKCFTDSCPKPVNSAILKECLVKNWPVEERIGLAVFGL